MSSNKLNKNSPIGIFDSGLGGLSILEAMKQHLPNEDIYYYGDSLNAPYGTKEVYEVINLSKNIVDKMIQKHVKAIVIACNTATSAAADYLRAMYDLPIIGIEPAIKPAILKYPKGRILVLATEMTLTEKKFDILLNTYKSKAEVIKCAAPKLVQLIEKEQLSDKMVASVLSQLLNGQSKKFDAVVLGCTHFIFLKNKIASYFTKHVEIFDGNQGTVIHLKEILKEKHLLNDHRRVAHRFIYNSAGPQKIEQSYRLLECDL